MNNEGKKCKRGPVEISSKVLTPSVIGHAITLKTKETGINSSVNYWLPFCHSMYWAQYKVLGKFFGDFLYHKLKTVKLSLKKETSTTSLSMWKEYRQECHATSKTVN